MEYFVVFAIFYFTFTLFRVTIIIAYHSEITDLLYIEEEIVRTLEFLGVGMFMYYAYQHNLFNIQEWFFDMKQFYKIYGHATILNKLF